MTEPVGKSETATVTTADAGSPTVLERLEQCVGSISLGFDRWEDPRAHGPGLYFVVESGSVAGFVQSVGANRWPVERCESVFGDAETLFETAQSVAFSCDGAVVVHADGTIDERLVRITQLSTAQKSRIGDLPYAEWMGTRHMSALETSAREEVLAVVTLSEEDGRMTVFRDGTFEDYGADALEKRFDVPG